MPLLKIRAEQMAALSGEVERNDLDEVIVRFSALHPEIDDMRARIDAILKRARKYGFTRNDAFIDWFIELDLARGFEWELIPEMDCALDILNHPEVDPSGKRSRLEKLLRSRTNT